MKALFVSQRPSDYVEMKRAALALRSRGVVVCFIYYFRDDKRPEDKAVRADLDGMVARGIIEKALYFGQTVE